MKNNIILIISFLFCSIFLSCSDSSNRDYSSKANNQSKIQTIPNSRKVHPGTNPIIDNLEIMKSDLYEAGFDTLGNRTFNGNMNWDDAQKACSKLGDGWRLPSKKELNILCENMDKIGGFSSDPYCSYWSSSVSHEGYAWSQSFAQGFQCTTLESFKEALLYVRPVRNY